MVVAKMLKCAHAKREKKKRMGENENENALVQFFLREMIWYGMLFFLLGPLANEVKMRTCSHEEQE